MKKIYYLITVAIALTVVSCSKFLEQSSQDLIRPETVEHYKEVLQGEGYFKDYYKTGWVIESMTDNFMVIDPEAEAGLPSGAIDKAQFAYKWAQDIETPEGTYQDNFFRMLYKNVLAANTVIEALDIMVGTDKEKELLKGQAHFTRAYAYFVLANTYAMPYNESSDDTPCVPLITSTTPTLKGYPRSTMKEVWDVIIEDIEIAVDALSKDDGFRSVYEINYNAALILASRIFLFTEDFEKSITYGERYIRMNPELKSITDITSSPIDNGANNNQPTFLYPFTNPEIAWTFSKITHATQEGSYFFHSNGTTYFDPVAMGVSAGVEGALIDTYEDNDRRKNHWFVQPTGLPGGFLVEVTYKPAKMSYYDKIYFTQNMRTGEVYLNLAEAYLRSATPKTTDAIDLLNTLRSNRIASYTPLTSGDLGSPEAILQFTLEERRRELCYEEFHRWWDLRRHGMPSITHYWFEEKYVLEKNDPAYVLNFPKEELDFNKELEPNVRPNRQRVN